MQSHLSPPSQRSLSLKPIIITQFLAGILVAGLALSALAQSDRAALEFSVQAAPTDGRPEKVMRQPFYLLRARLAEIQEAARQQVARPDLNAFVDELQVSTALKEWMKGNQTVTLQGEDFLGSLTTDDTLDVPEFRDAYVTRNTIMVGLGFPKRKAKLTDREKNPERWAESEKRYWEEVRSYLVLHPESKQGMDEHLLKVDAGVEWKGRLERYEEQVRQKLMQLLYSHYLVAQTETNYEGSAGFSNLFPGRYWLTNLWREVRAGDVRLRWELAVDLRPGQTHYLELNNANASFPPDRH